MFLENISFEILSVLLRRNEIKTRNQNKTDYFTSYVTLRTVYHPQLIYKQPTYLPSPLRCPVNGKGLFWCVFTFLSNRYNNLRFILGDIQRCKSLLVTLYFLVLYEKMISGVSEPVFGNLLYKVIFFLRTSLFIIQKKKGL